MTAGANSRSRAPDTAAPLVEYITPHLSGSRLAGERTFKNHKTLPHPRRERQHGDENPRPSQRKYALSIETALSADSSPRSTSPHALKHESRRIGGGPDLPPTPPAHSRTSSSGHCILPSTPTYVESPLQSTENVHSRLPTTPTNQRSPPTPDVTPPHAYRDRPTLLRPPVSDRTPSKTTTDSRTESFKTAREHLTSDEEDIGSTCKPALPSAKTSQSTVRQTTSARNTLAVGLGLGLESGPDNRPAPKTRSEFLSFDGDWGSGSEVEQQWDDNLMRTVTVRKRRQLVEDKNRRRREAIEDFTVSPTNAVKAMRAMPMKGRVLTYPLPKGQQSPAQLVAASAKSESPMSADVRRSSGMSSKSGVSTVVEAILVGTPPRRQKTLRHVQKQLTLRDSASDLSPGSSTPPSVLAEDALKHLEPCIVANAPRHQSLASTITNNSISSRKARREVWKSGGIPVVVVPDRRSSAKANNGREPSLRSTSSQRSKRSQSLGSAPLSQTSRSKDHTPIFERPTRWTRRFSESDGSAINDQRTMDYPPAIPTRSSSLSAPTSRNGSRAGSLTAESLKAHDLLQSQLPRTEDHARGVFLKRATSVESLNSDKSVNDHPIHRISVDKHGDPLFGKRLSLQKTPFSQTSADTNLTSHAEVSEAMAVNIYPHQNSSVLVVNHSNKPSEASENSQKDRSIGDLDIGEPAADGMIPVATKTETEEVPVTPPHPTFSMDDVDSPLRNPRAPPEPPVIKFIPATPSGMTPALEKQKQLGNYFEKENPKPAREMSLVRRALTRRRHSLSEPPPSRNPGFLIRTFSLSKNGRRETADNVRSMRGEDSVVSTYPAAQKTPPDDSKLHPFWRPADPHPNDEGQNEIYRYPPIDNRPRPRRTLSDRMKRTFAILPIQDPEDEYLATPRAETDRRTVQRTPSGNLRIVKHRASLESLRQRNLLNEVRPFTAPERSDIAPQSHFWQSHNLSQAPTHASGNMVKGHYLSALSSKIEGYSLGSIARRISDRRREKRSKELRDKISAPREVRDGVGEVIKRNSQRIAYE